MTDDKIKLKHQSRRNLLLHTNSEHLVFIAISTFRAIYLNGQVLRVSASDYYYMSIKMDSTHDLMCCDCDFYVRFAELTQKA